MALSNKERIDSKLTEFKKKFYLAQIVRGTIVCISVILGAFLFISLLEFIGNFARGVRTVLFFSYLAINIYLVFRYIFIPILSFLRKDKQLPDEQAAGYIGSYFPGINDRLLNFIQLKNQSKQNALVEASVDQKAANLSVFEFTQAVDYSKSKSYLKYFLGVVVAAVVLSLVNPQILSTGSERVINYNKTFVPVAPFQFSYTPGNATAYRNEDFTVELTLTGNSIPENVFIENKGRRMKMQKISAASFSYSFPKIQSDKEFRFEAAGFFSEQFSIKVIDRPNLRNFNVELNYPNYLGKAGDRFDNIGNLEIPEGTSVKWLFNTLETNSLSIIFPDSSLQANTTSTDIFEIERQIRSSQNYKIKLANEFSENREDIEYTLNVIPDKFPEINVNVYQDTVLFNYIVLGGNISDDYGITGLRLFYQEKKETNSNTWESVSIPFNDRQINQSYYYRWDLDSLLNKEGDEINYYLAVYDNDGFNGVKSSKTGTYTFQIPTDEEIKAEIESNSQKTESDIEDSIEEAKELKESIEEMQDKLKGKKELGWQDEKMLEEIKQKRDELNETLNELQQQFENEKAKRERFEKLDESFTEKAQQIQDLMKELLDEETLKLYEELMEMLENEGDSREIQEKLDEINKNEENLEKELERTLELFKRMKFELKLDEAISELEELSNEQDSLSNKTNESNKEDLEELAEEQENLKEKFEEFEESLNNLKELNQEMERPESMSDFSEQQNEIKQEMQKAQQELQQKNKKKASEAQDNARKQMQKMNQEMQQMQAGMEMQMMQANLDDLRDILQNLLTLSFNQEELMKEFKGVDQSDPRFVELGQEQLKIRDDAKIVEDSLISLANRAFQLQSFVTREVAEMNTHLDGSINAIRERTRSKAVSEQQFAMTSMNNLALMLDDALSNMQQNMQDALGKKGNKGNVKMPSLSELQESLNQKIEDLKRSGKQGRELSEELAKLAAEQERIRQALKEMEEKYGEGEGGGYKEILKEMEDSEEDIVNKRISAELIQRQKQILTRLLEAEKSLRERELDDEREGETAREYDSIVPGAFEEYFKAKEKEVELLKTVPPKLYPYYKKEVDDYFKRIGSNTLDQ